MDGNCDSGRLVAHVQDTAWHVAEMRAIDPNDQMPFFETLWPEN